MRIPHPKQNQGAPPTTCTMLYLGKQRGVFSKVVLGLRNFGYDFWGIGGDVWLCRHVRRKVFTHVDGGSSMRRPGCEDPHWRERKFCYIYCLTSFKYKSNIKLNTNWYHSCHHVVNLSIFIQLSYGLNQNLFKKRFYSLLSLTVFLWRYTYITEC